MVQATFYHYLFVSVVYLHGKTNLGSQDLTEACSLPCSNTVRNASRVIGQLVMVLNILCSYLTVTVVLVNKIMLEMLASTAELPL